MEQLCERKRILIKMRFGFTWVTWMFSNQSRRKSTKVYLALGFLITATWASKSQLLMILSDILMTFIWFVYNSDGLIEMVFGTFNYFALILLNLYKLCHKL